MIKSTQQSAFSHFTGIHAQNALLADERVRGLNAECLLLTALGPRHFDSTAVQDLHASAVSSGVKTCPGLKRRVRSEVEQ